MRRNADNRYWIPGKQRKRKAMHASHSRQDVILSESFDVMRGQTCELRSVYMCIHLFALIDTVPFKRMIAKMPPNFAKFLDTPKDQLHFSRNKLRILERTSSHGVLHFPEGSHNIDWVCLACRLLNARILG